MSPVMAASRAVVCALAPIIALGLALAGGAGRAWAERRPVAVVNLDLTGAPEPQALAAELLGALDPHPALRAMPLPGAIAALYEPLRDDDTPLLDAAQRSLAAAREQLAELDPEQALRFTDTGQLALLTASPALAGRPYAELAFVAGVALHDLGRADDARAAFALCARLDPARAPDPARYVPGVIALYQAARAAPPSPASLEVRGEGAVWIDGAEVGRAPATFPVGAGRHVVWLTGVARETRGERVTVAPGATAVVVIPDAPADARTRLVRARVALARAPDPTARAAAMRRLAELAGVADAVLISAAGATLIVQTWRAGDVARAPGFGALRERGASPAPELLAPLAPPAPAVRPPDGPPIGPPIGPPGGRPRPARWYARTPVRAALVLGVLGALATRGGGWFEDGFQPDIGFPDPGTTGRR